MVRLFFNRSMALLLIGVSVTFVDPAFAEGGKGCAERVLQAIVGPPKKAAKSVREFWGEVKEKGWSRVFIKDRPPLETLSDQKFWGILKEVDRSQIGWTGKVGRATEDVVQWVPRKVTRKIFGKAYDFKPYSFLYEGAEHLILPAGKTFTRGTKITIGVGVGIAIYPFTGIGLWDRAVTEKEKEKVEQTADDLIENDYRFRSIKNYRDQNRVTQEQARNLAVQLIHSYESYQDAMKQLEKNGLNYRNPASTDVLLSDSTVMNHIGPLFADVFWFQDIQSYRGKDSASFDVSHFKEVDPEILHELMKVNHEKIRMQSNVVNLFEYPERLPADFREAIGKASAFQLLKQKVAEKKMSVKQAEYTYSELIQRASAFKMYDIMGVVRIQTEPNGQIDTLRIEDAERELLDRLPR